MRNTPPEDCIIDLAKALKISENRLIEALMNELENENDTCDDILDDLYWEFKEDNYITTFEIK